MELSDAGGNPALFKRHPVPLDGSIGFAPLDVLLNPHCERLVNNLNNRALNLTTLFIVRRVTKKILEQIGVHD